MRRSILAFPLLLFPVATAAAEAPPAQRILDAALADSKAYDRLAWLCDHVGPRLSGSRELEQAVLWAEATMKGDGADRVWKDDVAVPRWIRGRAEGTIYIGVRLQGDGFEIHNTTFDGAIETGVEVKERACASVLRGNHFNVSGVPVRLGGAISPMLRRNHFFAPADPRVPAIDVGAAATPRLDENFFVGFTQPVAPMRRDLSLQGNVIIPPAARR